jgi:serine/threonine-protein kinase
MATVYLAHDLKHDRDVALKVLRPELAAVLGRERFLAEIHLTAKLDHPHILTLIDSGESDDFLWYVVPFIRGESLRQKLAREKQLGVEDALAIARQVAGALDHAHRHGVIHRDVKPENILLHEGEAMLADFGIALAVQAAAGKRLTETGLSVGTPQYMSPEQATAERQVDGRTDVYSLGAVLYEMLAGEPPFTGATGQAVIAKLMTERPTPLRTLRPGLPEGVDAAVQRALAKVPADRFGSAGQLIAALTAAASPVPATNAAARRRRQVMVLAAILVLFGGAGVVLPRLEHGSRGPSVAARRSQGATPEDAVHPRRVVIVLPLANVGGDPRNEYFADGMTDELSAALARVPGLRVMGRSTAFSFKGKPADPRDLSGRFGVTHVLEGSVRRAGAEIRLTVELVDAGDGLSLWSETYTRTTRDVFRVQEEIARATAGALRLALGVGGPGGADSSLRGTASPARVAAHDLYLKGRFAWSQRSPESLRQAIGYYRQALAADSSFAPAWAGLAETYVLQPLYDAGVPSQETWTRTQEAAARALALDTSQVDAQVALGFGRIRLAWDWAGGEAALRAVVARHPDHVGAHQQYGVTLLVVGRSHDAVEELRRAQALDPLSMVTRRDLATALALDGRYAEAEAQFNEGLRLDPDFSGLHDGLGYTYVAEGRYREAIATLEVDSNSRVGPIMILALVKAGERDSAESLLRAFARRVAEKKAAVGGALASAYAAVGEVDSAFACLTRAIEEKRPMPAFFSPLLAPLRQDPRWPGLLAKVGLPSR